MALISPLNSPLLSPTDDGALGASMDEVMKLNEHSGPLRDGIATNKTPKLKDQNGSSDEVRSSGVSSLRDQNGQSNEGMTNEASRFKDDFVALKGVRTIEALKPSDQNGALRKEVLPHETSRLMDQNGTSKEELPHEALKLSDQNGASKEEELSVEVPKKRVQNGALDWRAYETSNVENLPPTVVDVQPPPFERIVRKNFLICIEFNFLFSLSLSQKMLLRDRINIFLIKFDVILPNCCWSMNLLVVSL